MKILVGYKHRSNLSEDLLELALTHAIAFKGSVMIVTSLDEGHEDDQKLINETEAFLEKARSRFDQKGIPCETHLLIRGLSAGEDLLAFAEEKKAGEIIIGVKSRSNVSKMLFGSTARLLILQADCPVVTMR